ncbi:MAG: sialidase family protein [Gemmataceae bacterium]
MFVFEKAPFPSCHASTIVEVEPGRLLCAWFGGKAEGARDVRIWQSAFDGKSWSKPEMVAEEPGYPCWNPVLFRSARGTLSLFYKAGPSPMTWSGFVQTSKDGGKSWSKASILEAGLLGPIKNKPIEHKGVIISPTSVESHRAWCSWVERSTDDGKTWTRHGPIAVPGKPHGLIQPTLLTTAKGHLIALCRSRGIGFVCQSESTDEGLTWSPARPTTLLNPNSGIDGVTAKDGAHYLAFNNARLTRWPLNLARSTDDGKTWKVVATAEDTVGEFSYPALIQASDGKLHLTYTWNRNHIKHLTFDPAKLGG